MLLHLLASNKRVTRGRGVVASPTNALLVVASRQNKNSCRRIPSSSSLNHPFCSYWTKSQHRRWIHSKNLPHELPNTGSTARDVLAAERTFLAWARTGLGFVGAGTALPAAYSAHAKEPHDARIIAAAAGLLISNGAAVLVFATHRYYTVLQCLMRDVVPIHPYRTLWAIAGTSITTLTSLCLIATVEYQKQQQEQEQKDEEDMLIEDRSTSSGKTKAASR